MKSPFKFLDAFELKDKDVFFGRAEETDALYAMVFKTPLLLVYGLSGTGKTSLIQCGLASRFSGPNWYPFFIRRGDNINASVRKALQPALPPGETLRESLRDNVSTLFSYYLSPPYLIFDQFEELFILGDRDEQLEFARSVRELIDAKLPAKVILVMREEFIGQLYHLEREIPTIYDFRVRVEPMGYKKVQEVIAGSFGRFNIGLEAPEQNILRMYDNISAGKSGIQLPYLQVYLDMLWTEDFARTYSGVSNPPEDSGEGLEAGAESSWPSLHLSTAEIDAFGKIEDVLARFLLDQEQSLQADMAQRFPGLPAGAVRKIVNAFVTEEGTKRPVRFTRENEHYLLDREALANLPVLPEGALNYALERLQNARLLRERDEALELAHDSLAALIDQERSDEERMLNDIRTRLRSAFKEYQLSVASGHEYHFNNKILLDVTAKLRVLELPPILLQFYQYGINYVERMEDIKLEAAKRVAREEEAQRRARKEVLLRRQAVSRAALAGILAFLAIVAASFAWIQSIRADQARQEAEQNAALANEQQRQAEQARQAAQDSAYVALQQRQLAEQNKQKAEKALTDLAATQKEKEYLQISDKTEIVESFLNAGSCELARAAMIDLVTLVKKYPREAYIQQNTDELRQRVEACKN